MFDKWALSQLHLYKPFRDNALLHTPTIKHVFLSHLAAGGFRALQLPNDDNDDNEDDNDSDNNDNDSQSAINLAAAAPVNQEQCLRQDDYQQIMLPSRALLDTMHLLGLHKLDLAHHWQQSWQCIPFDTLLSWLPRTKDLSVLPDVPPLPIDIATLSSMQCKVLDIIVNHVFGASQHEQLLMIMLGTASTGKSYLINAIRHVFSLTRQTHALKVTAPTGIAASNICGSTIHSLLSLLNENLMGACLHALQDTMKDIRLLIIDEYSFLSIPMFDTLDCQLHKAFPSKADCPFGGLNIILSGDPAQLAPVCGQPVYAFPTGDEARAARFCSFQTVVELDQPFHQAGSDQTQVHFCQVLTRVANCEADEADWIWLQSRRPSCLSAEENSIFNLDRHIVATNDVCNHINHDKLVAFAPVLCIDNNDNDLWEVHADNFDDDLAPHSGAQLYAVGAQVMLTANLWTETGLVNGACGIVHDILQPPDERHARVLMVDFPRYRGPALSPSQPTVVPISQIRSGNCKGMPLTLSWAVTIHKSQGMSLDRVTVDLCRNEFASGLTFVALSRSKTFCGLRILLFDFQWFKHIENGRHVLAHRVEFHCLRTLAAATTN